MLDVISGAYQVRFGDQNIPGPPERPQRDPQTPKGYPNLQNKENIDILPAFGVPQTLLKGPPDRHKFKKIALLNIRLLTLNFCPFFCRFALPKRLQNNTNLSPMPARQIL